MEILRAEHVSYSYQSKYQKVEAVKDVSCSFEKGKFYAIVGESGSGKSTFLSLLAGLDQPCDGTIYVQGEPLSGMDRDDYRLNRAAVVYQAFHLFPLLTAQENVMLPLEFKKMRKKEAARQARRLLQRVGLETRIYRQFPKMMSGGEQQRVAIARAVAAGGEIILADEPTGNLDSGNEENVVALLKELAHEDGYTVIVITHNQRVADETDHVFCMKDGRMEQIR
ncbi:MAG: ABC transporter ATP-binding protein [Lachnospiraceae bacterium]|nr:ABC transporter ATP-binding protein [Lachnospiraceae bacterium]MDE6602086.1 ABC transporter ATP-binding protein [Lachnospiraceae bacterium]